MELEKKEVKMITAKEARAKAETSEFLQRLVFRDISAAASRNECSVCVIVENVATSVVNSLKDVLKSQGYSVEYETLEDEDGVEEPRINFNMLIVRW